MSKRIKIYHPDSALPIEVYESQVADLEARGWTTEPKGKKAKSRKPASDQPAEESES